MQGYHPLLLWGYISLVENRGNIQFIHKFQLINHILDLIFNYGRKHNFYHHCSQVWNNCQQKMNNRYLCNGRRLALEHIGKPLSWIWVITEKIIIHQLRLCYLWKQRPQRKHSSHRCKSKASLLVKTCKIVWVNYMNEIFPECSMNLGVPRLVPIVSDQHLPWKPLSSKSEL